MAAGEVSLSLGALRQGRRASTTVWALISGISPRTSEVTHRVSVWSVDDLRPYFKRTEHAPRRTATPRCVESAQHRPSEQPTPHPVGVAGLAAAQHAGFRCAYNVSGGPG